MEIRVKARQTDTLRGQVELRRRQIGMQLSEEHWLDKKEISTNDSPRNRTGICPAYCRDLYLQRAGADHPLRVAVCTVSKSCSGGIAWTCFVERAS
jgi:hypothetical protein